MDNEEHDEHDRRAFLKGSYPVGGPGAAVIVMKDGRTLFEKAYGMADLELGVPLRPDMVFRLGSITVTVENGRLYTMRSPGQRREARPSSRRGSSSL